MTPRDIAKLCTIGPPIEDEIEDAIARYVLSKDRRIFELEDALDRIRRLQAADGMTKGPADAFFEAVSIADVALQTPSGDRHG